MNIDVPSPLVLGPSGLPLISDLDVACGYLHGPGPAAPLPERIRPDPVRALQDALLPALLRSPCVIAFSGGRDSSLLLAMAAHLAAREGVDPPIALTFRYPGDGAADESSWQHLVIDHLARSGVRVSWTCQDIGTELDLIGPLLAPVLSVHGGPTFPPTLGAIVLLARQARGGSLITGNFGDEVLGGHRAAVLRTALRRRGRGFTRGDWLATVHAATPGAVHRRLTPHNIGDPAWLRPALRRQVLQNRALAAAARPLRWDRSVRSALENRAVATGQVTRSTIARDEDCLLVEPLGAPDFVACYAAFGGRWGSLSREAGMRLLAAGLLPEAIIRRRQKAYFNASRFGPVSKDFVRSWDGGGLDEDLVDPAALRKAWSAAVPPASTAMLLQQAWLARCGGSVPSA